MREQYRQAMGRVHAPGDLIDRTKMAMRREEELLKGRKQKKKTPAFFVPAGVAAAALALVLFMMQAYGKRTLSTPETEMNHSAVLLEQLELSPEKIIPGMTKEEKEFLFYLIQEFPREFLTESDEEIVGEIPVRFVKDERTGFYKAVFQWDSRKYLAVSRTINKELLEQAIKSFLASFKETHE